MTRPFPSGLSPHHVDWLEVLVCQYTNAWKSGQTPSLESVLPAQAEQRRQALLPLIRCDQHQRRQAQLPPVPAEEYLQRFPDLPIDSETLRSLLETEKLGESTEDAIAPAADARPAVNFPSNPTHPPASASGKDATASLPKTVGRYRIEKLLGEGSLGRVYLAHDDQLLRRVAIKVPHSSRMSGPGEIEELLAGVRAVTRLEHPQIVPVLDVGNPPADPFFVVSKYLDGMMLDERLRSNRPPIAEALTLIVSLAQTLHFAHAQGVFHLALHPRNILLDPAGQPLVADFGLASREPDRGYPSISSLAYRSPEQLKAEGHRVDGRSDLFSLGVIFYQLLTGQLPFPTPTVAGDFLPPRHWNPAIPIEIERICCKALAWRSIDRYDDCNSFADDLADCLVNTGGAIHPPLQILPRGLRSFDARDADFFLELLPGPRDRHGLPDSVRFWKERIEEKDGRKTFAVGLLYGPSGCGKSSLLKAGLLPRLGSTIVPVVVEASGDETEIRLLRALRKQCADVPGDLDLVDTLIALRRKKVLPAEQKVLIVLDQFEQWLHAHGREVNPELVQALRQCDGGVVQCLVLVRDDFWMAATRFLHALEIQLLEGTNALAFDLFGVDHAEKVLTAFGGAYGKLPEAGRELSREQQEFVKQAVSGLAEEDKVVSVRLALFADMMKSRPWTPATLRNVGGTAGVGVTFLEETFSASSAPARQQYYAKAARGVLQKLLPELGSNIKGNQRSWEELRSSADLRDAEEFPILLQLLDGELRLITPVDPASGGRKPPDSDSVTPSRHYQLTHDYLVPAIRDWLTRKQKETARGRAELLLADRAAIWTARPEPRQFPSLLQVMQIRRLTNKNSWTTSQRAMMRQATRYHFRRVLIASSLLLLLTLASSLAYCSSKGRQLIGQLMSASLMGLPDVVQRMGFYRPWVNAGLEQLEANAITSNNEGQRLQASLALLPSDPAQLEYLKQRLLDGTPQQVETIRKMLLQYLPTEATPALSQDFWAILQNSAADGNQRFRAACLLALLTPADERWPPLAATLTDRLVSQEPVDVLHWMRLLQPVGPQLLPALAQALLDPDRPAMDRDLLAHIYHEYSLEIPGGYDRLEAELGQPLPGRDPLRDTQFAALKKQANAGVSLVLMNHADKVWPYLKHQPDPGLRSYLIAGLGASKVDPHRLLHQLHEASDVSIQRAILLSFPAASVKKLSAAEQQEIADLYRDHPDAGIHSAARWVLQRWGKGSLLQQIDADLQRRAGRDLSRSWHLNSQGQTLLAVPGSTPGLTLSAATVTIDQFQRFRKEYKPGNASFAQAGDYPTVDVNWYEAVAYCNWLSKQEGIPPEQWCYLPNEEGQYASGMRIRDGFFKLAGYRLPTELEWEHAARAGATNSIRFCFGDATDLLEGYGWFGINANSQTQPVQQLKPNDWGLL